MNIPRWIDYSLVVVWGTAVLLAMLKCVGVLTISWLWIVILVLLPVLMVVGTVGLAVLLWVRSGGR